MNKTYFFILYLSLHLVVPMVVAYLDATSQCGDAPFKECYQMTTTGIIRVHDNIMQGIIKYFERVPPFYLFIISPILIPEALILLLAELLFVIMIIIPNIYINIILHQLF